MSPTIESLAVYCCAKEKHAGELPVEKQTFRDNVVSPALSFRNIPTCAKSLPDWQACLLRQWAFLYTTVLHCWKKRVQKDEMLGA